MDSLAKRRRNFVFKDPPAIEPVTRDQIRGADTLLCRFDEVVELLRHFRELDKAGAQLPAGMLLHGPKGTGKSFLMRYLATVLDVRFIDMRRFPLPKVQKREVLLSPEDVRALLSLAREYVRKFKKPIVLGYDGFDRDVDAKVRQELRIQIEGIYGRMNGVFFVFSSVQPPALIDEGGQLFRPGRISIWLHFDYPTPMGRLDVLRHYVSLVPHDPAIDFKSIAFLLEPGTTPAAIRDLVNLARNDALLEEKQKGARIGQKHLLKQALSKLLGQVLEECLTEGEKRKVAYHEAGHAALGRLLGLPVQAVTVFPTVDAESAAHGTTFSIVTDEKLLTVDQLEDRIIMCLGGVMVEELFGIPRNVAMEQDLESITSLAQLLAEKLLGGQELRRRFGCLILNRDIEYSESILALSERDAGRILKRAERRAGMLVEKVGKERIERVAEALFERKILLQNELDALLGDILSGAKNNNQE